MMQLIYAVAGLLVPIVLGVSLVLIILPKNASLTIFIHKIILGAVVGFALTSSLLFLYLVFFNNLSGNYYQIAETVLALIVLSLAAKKTKFSPFSLKLTRLKIILFAVVAYFTIQFLLNLIYLVFYQPYGGGDAFAIWNLKARFMCRNEGLFWKNLFNENVFWSHPDYPLFLPASICRIWTYLGDESLFVPMFFSAAMTFLVFAIVLFGLWIHVGIKKALLAGLLLAATPRLLTWGTSQYADVPLSLYMVSAVSCFLISQENKENRNYLLIGIFLAASCLWVKSEGLFFFLIYIGNIFLYHLRNRREEIKSFFKKILISLFPVSVYVLLRLIAVFNDKFLRQNLPELINKFFSVERHLVVIEAFISGILYLGEWFVNPWIIVAALLFIFGACDLNRRNHKKKSSVLILVSMLAVYYCFYIFSPRGLKWHLDTSLSRLLIQLWPLIVLNIFLLMEIENYE